MSVASHAGTALAVLAAAGATISLWRGAEHHVGHLRHAYRWLAAAAGLWGIGVIMAQTLSASVGVAAIPLSLADLPALLALPAVAAALLRLASPPTVVPAARAAWHDPGRAAAWLADGYVAASALFLIGWVVIFGSAFAQAGIGPGAFTADMVRPLADLALLGGALPLVAAAGRRGLAPYLAAVAMTVGDSLAVSAQITGTTPGVAAMASAVVGFALLGHAPWDPRVRWGILWWLARARSMAGWAAGRSPGAAGPASGLAGRDRADPSPAAPEGPGRVEAGRVEAGRGEAGRDGRDGGDLDSAAAERDAPDQRAPAGQPVTVVVAACAAGLSALSLIIWGIAGEPMAQPVVPLVAGTMVLTLAARLLGLVGREHLVLRSWRDSHRQFRQLADRTTDAVLLSDAGGVIRYANRAVAGYGYSPEALRGSALADLLHPEDRADGVHAVRQAVSDSSGRPGRCTCRVRAADGTWHHVEATVSRYRQPGGRGDLLVTARDVSDQVELRRQVTHLTFHDGLTGLPNRAYVEQRARAGLAAGGAVRPARVGGSAPVRIAGVIFLDLDAFTAVNDDVGHSAGDLLLAQVAHRLRGAVPPRDTVARWGGDEFAVLVEGEVSAEEIVDVAERLARGVASLPFRVGERDVALTASVGVALPGEGPIGYVWRNADAAMARAKVLGGGRVEVFDGGRGPDGRGLEDVPQSETKLLSG